MSHQTGITGIRISSDLICMGNKLAIVLSYLAFFVFNFGTFHILFLD